MKILMIAPEPFFESRGTPISVYQRLCALSNLGHNVDLLTYHIGLSPDLPGVRIFRVPNIPFIQEVKIGPSGPKLFLDMILFFQAAMMLSRNGYDVIHSHEEAAFFSAVLARIFRVRHLYDMHSSLPRQLISFGFSRRGLVVGAFRLLERWTVRKCDAMLTIGDDLERHIRSISPKTRLVKIENLPIHSIPSAGSPESSVQQLREQLRLSAALPVVYTGTLETYQGIGLLLDSAVIVREHAADISFVIVGGKPQQIEYWQKEAKARQLDGCVHFTGTVSPAEVVLYLEMAEILVSPRVNGMSTPLKVYSYLWSGKPTVATNVLAHTQVLNEENAYLVAPDKESFAAGILRLARNPELRQRIGRQAQEYAHSVFDSGTYQAKMDQAYKMLATSTQIADRPDLRPVPPIKTECK